MPTATQQGVLTHQQLEKVLQQIENIEQNIQQLPKEQQIRYWHRQNDNVVWREDPEKKGSIQGIWTHSHDKWSTCGDISQMESNHEISQQQAYDLLKEHNPDAIPDPANITLEDLGLTLEHKVAAKIQEKLDTLNKTIKDSEGNLVGNPDGLTVQGFMGGGEAINPSEPHMVSGTKQVYKKKADGTTVQVGSIDNPDKETPTGVEFDEALKESPEHFHQLTDEEIVGFYGKAKTPEYPKYWLHKDRDTIVKQIHESESVWITLSYPDNWDKCYQNNVAANYKQISFEEAKQYLAKHNADKI